MARKISGKVVRIAIDWKIIERKPGIGENDEIVAIKDRNRYFVPIHSTFYSSAMKQCARTKNLFVIIIIPINSNYCCVRSRETILTRF